MGGKPQNKVKIEWSPNFAYAIGLLATDGCLSKDGRHIDFTSNDKEQLLNFLKCLRITDAKITEKHSGSSINIGLRVQFSDVNFYRFLVSIGLMPKKSKIINEVQIPDQYFFDFLRGHFDGDGSFYSYWDPRWKSSYMFYTSFTSASENHIKWLRNRIFDLLGINGHISKAKMASWYSLRYAKKDSVKLLDKLYRGRGICLSRKYLKIHDALFIMSKLPKK